MNSFQKRILAAMLVGAAIVTAVYIPLRKDTVIHTAYGTLLLAVILSGASLWQLAKTTARDYMTSVAFPLALKAYLAATVAMAVLFATLDLTEIWSISFKWYAVLQVIIIGLTAWKLLAIGAGQDAIRQVDEGVQTNMSNWKLLLADVDAVLQSAPAGMRREIAEVRDAIRYADPMSRAEVVAQEQEIAADISLLRDSVSENKADKTRVLCTKLINLIKDRANRLKVLKELRTGKQ